MTQVFMNAYTMRIFYIKMFLSSDRLLGDFHKTISSLTHARLKIKKLLLHYKQTAITTKKITGNEEEKNVSGGFLYSKHIAI